MTASPPLRRLRKVVRSSWGFASAGRVLVEIDSRSSTGEEVLFSLSKSEGLIPYAEHNEREHRADSLVGYKRFQPGDIVMNRMQAWNGVFGLADQSGLVSPDYVVLRVSRSEDPRFYKYLLKTDLMAGIFKAFSTGVGTGFLRLQRDELRQIPLPIVAPEKQRLIADFLDRETHRIDALVDAKRRMIDRLAEKRQAAIDVNLRWPDTNSKELVRLKFILKSVIDTEHKTVHFVPEGDYPVVRTSDIREGRLLLDQARRTDEGGYVEWTRRGRPVQGDVLLTREAPAGEAAVVSGETPVCIGQRVVLLRLSSLIDPGFLVHSMYSSRTKTFIDLASQGSTVAHLNMADIPNIPIWTPSVHVQREVRDRLDRHIATIQTTQETLHRQLDLLTEYRQALITQAVTGQLDEATLKGDKPVGEAVGVISE